MKKMFSGFASESWSLLFNVTIDEVLAQTTPVALHGQSNRFYSSFLLMY